MRVLIADDHAVVRRGIQEILSDAYENVITVEAVSAEEALELVRTRELDIAILDISMPGRSGLDALKEIKKSHPDLPVLILSIHPEEQFATRAFKAGASGYLTKESAPTELVFAINKALAGGKYVSETLAERLAEDLKLDSEEGPLHKKLSDREYEVLLLIASGKSISEIANQFSLSVKTISTYRSRILEKMNMKGNADIVRYAINNNLIE